MCVTASRAAYMHFALDDVSGSCGPLSTLCCLPHLHRTMPRPRKSSSWLMLFIPTFFVRFIYSMFLDRYTTTEKVPATLVSLTEFVGERCGWRHALPVLKLRSIAEAACVH